MPVYFAHATSFCGEVWRPVIERLAGVDCVTWDFAGHGHGPELDVPVHWSSFGDQVLDETEQGGIGVGHSMGACALVMAQLRDPERFRFLLLIEPIIFPGPHGRQGHPLMEAAAKRKSSFDSRAAVFENFRSREAFADWDPDVLAAYIDCGFRGESPVTLACKPEVEAEIYGAFNDHDTYERLGDIKIPVLILSGEESDTIEPEFARAQAAQFVSAGVEIVPDTGHFLPMEMPGLVADRVLRIASTLEGQPGSHG